MGSARALRWIRPLLLATIFGIALPVMADDLVVWTFYRVRERAALEKMAAIYNAKKGASAPHVTVLSFPFDGFADRIARLVPRGDGPDLFIYPQDRLGGWVTSGNIIEPIDRFIGASMEDRFIPAMLRALTYRGYTYGLPLTFKTVTLIYNRKLVPQPPKTTAELAALAKSLTHRELGTYGLAYEYGNYYYHAALQNGFGGHVFDADMNPTIDSVENLRAIDLLLQWKRDFLPELSPSKAQVTTLFNEGKAAMIISGSWILPDLSATIDIGLTQLPTISEAGNRPMQPWMTVEGLFITAPCKQKEAAYDFMKYVTDLEAARALAIDSGFSPANQRAYVDPALAGDEKLAAFFKQVRVAVAMPNLPEMTVMWSPVFVAMSSIVEGNTAPEEALGRAQSRVAQAVAILHGPPRPPPGEQAAPRAR